MREVSPSLLDTEGSAQYLDPEAWLGVYRRLDMPIRVRVATSVHEHARELATLFYTEMLADPQARPLLSPNVVSQRLHSSLMRWLRNLFEAEATPDVAGISHLQFTVGEVHARIGVPVPLVLRGARILKAALADKLAQQPDLDRDELFRAQQFVGQLVDLAMEVMSSAYLTSTKRAARTDEAYRLFSLGQDVSMERERQRAALMEWSQSVLLDLYYTDRRNVLPTLRTSEFGLWIYHKGRAIFDGMPELAPLMRAVGEIDATVLPRLTAAVPQTGEERVGIEQLKQRVADIKFLLNALFDRISAVDAGRDPLTQLLNRRFLSSVLTREIALANRTHCPFAVMMVDIDHFKRINDRYGHDGGDAILRQAADVLQTACRASDYIFRYGGEEFLLLLVDTDREGLAIAAERVRLSFVERVFRVKEGMRLPITVSIGAALFDGHPDPQRLVTRADQALYSAKHAGRNRHVLDADDAPVDAH
ncbi:diguanylate cyclase [Verticiella sediminum]|uniref:Diguanylate cyclase DosC n=1 Tax=Verticiella sediminum TaxID=1247510 RepID=A0A556AS95_9BURK|nr:diguanylate cyclase [Verticiella sediminum]TSH95807.1 diguanylate cyclase [Verticiella sediminum]